MPDAIQTRREKMLEMFRTELFLSIHDLEEKLGVSQLTIRRDLDRLQEEGLVERTHGGAKLIQLPETQMDKNEVSFFVRRNRFTDEKKAIARAIVPYLKNDQVIILDASSTALFLAQAIPDDFNMTIITHSAYLPIELAIHPNLQVISTGGLLHSTSLCYLGIEAEQSMRQFHAHRAIFGAKGVSLQDGCTDASLLEIKLKSAMAQRAQELWIIADHSKIGNIALASFAQLSQVHTLVTDEQSDPVLIDEIKSQGVNVIVAPMNPDI